MTRITPLWGSDGLSIHRFDHPPEHEDRSFERVADRYAASFVECGEYCLEIGETRWRVGTGDVLLIHPGMHYRASSAEGPFTDVGLTVNYLAAEADGFDAAQTWARAQRPVLRATNRLRYLYWGVSRALCADLPLLAETCASELFREISESRRPAASLYGARKLAWYAERVHHAREMMETYYDREHRLADLAQSSGMSAFHFARVFKDLAGVSPHYFLLTARLKTAARMLLEGRSVTETCYACGFGNLSHFSRLFSRRYGVSPSVYPSGAANRQESASVRAL